MIAAAETSIPRIQEKGERSPLRKLILLNVLTHIWSGVCPPAQESIPIPVDGEITREAFALAYPSVAIGPESDSYSNDAYLPLVVSAAVTWATGLAASAAGGAAF